MMNKTLPHKVLRIAVSVLAIVTMSGLFPNTVEALPKTLQQLSIDDSIVQDDNAFSTPGRVVIVPIFPPQSEFPVQDEAWYRGLFYYLIANDQRSGFTDVPFHYAVSREGTTFKGNTGGEERKITIKDLGDDMVVIAYLAGRGDNGFDPRAADALAELLLDICNRNSIPPSQIEVAAARYVRDDASQTVSLQREDLFGLWSNSLKTLVEKVKPYSPIPREYKFSVTKVELPTSAVNPGEEVAGKITIRNNGTVGSYTGSASELFGTRMEGNSNFYLPGAWSSRSQFSLLAASGDLLPEDEQTYDFRLKVPLLWGDYVEDFKLRTANGTDALDSGFQLRLTINRPAGTIVEVKPNTPGFISAYAQTSSDSAEVRKLSTGERFFQVAVTENGWAQLDLGDGTTGWVAYWQLNYL